MKKKIGLVLAFTLLVVSLFTALAACKGDDAKQAYVNAVNKMAEQDYVNAAISQTNAVVYEKGNWVSNYTKYSETEEVWLNKDGVFIKVSGEYFIFNQNGPNNYIGTIRWQLIIPGASYSFGNTKDTIIIKRFGLFWKFGYGNGNCNIRKRTNQINEFY
ncbi:MAG: hypothetical protein FWG51_01625 [Firmicutes bacterium]|nr:hypothetical protein [Bacillota bacterium]